MGGDGGQTTLNRGLDKHIKISEKLPPKIQVTVFDLFSIEVAVLGLKSVP